jgi:hypothetical protein
VSISSNGYVCLGLNTACGYRKRPSPNDILVGLNYDLDTTKHGSGQIYYKNLKDSTSVASLYVNLLDPSFVPKNIFMITYDNVLSYYFPGSNSRVSFQLYLLTDFVKSYVIFKYASCPTDLILWAPSGLNSNNNGNLEEILIQQGKECSLSNVKQKGVWVSEVTTNYSLGNQFKC